MPKLSSKSMEKLKTCHSDLIFICEEVIKYYDFTVLEGARSLETQQKYFRQGLSKLDGINKKSKHQSYPSKAIDIAPYPLDFGHGLSGHEKSKALARFYQLSGYMFMCCEYLRDSGIVEHKLRWGGDWDSDKEFNDQSFDDLPHFELVRP